MLKLIVLNYILLIYCFNIVDGSGEGSNEENDEFFETKEEFDISSEIDEIDQHVKNQIAWILENARKCDEQEKCVNMFLNDMAMFNDLARVGGIAALCDNMKSEEGKIGNPIRELLNGGINNNDAKSRLNLYTKCVDNFFTKDRGLFQMKNSKPHELSEINEKLLRSFLLTKPLYIATTMYESIQNKDTNALLEIVSTQKLEDLNVAMKIMIALHPDLKLVKMVNEKVDFKEFSKGQIPFDADQLDQFLNWRFDPNCNEKPIENKIGWLNNPMKEIRNYIKNFKQRCLENPTISDYIVILENKKTRNNFFLMRFNCAMKAFENQKQDKTSLHVDDLIRTLILSYSNDEESITHLMKVNERKELEDKINNANFNLQGWNDKVFKYACKRFLNLENASQVMSYNRFIEHYGENIVAFTNALTCVENLFNIKIDKKKVKISNDKMFIDLNKVPGSSVVKNLIEEINNDILDKLDSKSFGRIKINNQKMEDLIAFSSNYLYAKYLALALALNQAVGKGDDKENKNKLISLKISDEQLDKIKSINFDSIKKLLDKMSIKLFDKYKGSKSNQNSDFVNDLINEMINLINDVDFKLSGDSGNDYSADFVDFRAIQLFDNGENKSFVDRLIEKIFNYLKRPIDWIRNKASNSKNIVFLNEFKQINSFVVVIENFITKKTSIEKLYFKLSKIKKNGENLSEKLQVFLNNFVKNLNDKNKLREEFLDLFPYLTAFGNALKINKNHKEIGLSKKDVDRAPDNLNKMTKNELKKFIDGIVKYIKEFSSNIKSKLAENFVENEKNNWPNLKYFMPKIYVCWFKFI
ncbi:unnamed protein product [Meloidogyne enterolobii]|uniref:Uncharacterized protein n=1 Tax=Meloidogyne enterolobii TaxID=390850 RepID=A0ACB1BAP8_MELEN